MSPRRAKIALLALASFSITLIACSTELSNNLPDPPSTPFVAAPTRPAPKLASPTPVATEYGFIMPRKAWTDASLQLRNANPLAPVDCITIHHSGDGKPFTGESPAEVASHLRAVRYAHLDRGMIDIGYHFAIDPAGRVWQLRWLAYEGQHVRPNKNGHLNNPHNIGIVLLGDFNLQNPSPQQLTRLYELTRILRAKYDLPPSAVRYHGEIVDTDCPGKRLAVLLQQAQRRHLF